MSEPIPVDRKGDFRAEIREYGLQKKDSGSVGIRMKFQLTECWNAEGEAWDDWRDHNVEAWGTSWIVKKDGTINQTAVESLIKNAGWDGDLASIVNNTWKPAPCQVSTEENVYNGVTSYPVNFINHYDRTPGANVGNVTADGLKELQTRFGSALRAVAGNAKRNTAPPAPVNGKGGPKAPPKREAAVPVAETVPPGANENDEIPF